MSKMINTVEKILRKFVVVTDGCWLWSGSVSAGGYGKVSFNGRLSVAHRVIYEHFKKPIPDGLQLDHLCRVRRCVNPDHLEPVTQRENLMRGIGPTSDNAKKIVCINGHDFSGSNLYVTKAGKRRCNECHRARVKDWWHRRGAENRKVARLNESQASK